MLTQSQIDFYHEQGYLGVENVLSAAEIAELRAVTDDFVEQSRQVSDHTSVFDLEPGHTAANPRLRRLKNPIEQHAVYDQTMRHPKILSIVAQLIGHGIRTNGNKLNMKYAQFGSPVEWHQDWSFYPHTNDDLLAVGIAIDPMTLENGCLLVIPGSHKGPVLNHHHSKGFFVGAVTEPNFDPSDAVPILLDAGGISIHHVRTLHGSAPNTSANPRRLLLYQYCANDAWPLVNFPGWEKFNEGILQGEPTNEPRVTNVPVRIPLPNGEKGGSIYETQTMMEKRHYTMPVLEKATAAP
ncbi:MAG: phytanoyl-CoA dioxygenase family protein [Caldilineaceae bacterium]|nr:phytanoyl-CoA dioxygenase family protein [Caldilineaceae bacterium]